ncbi:MAG: hypothetical protein ACE149_10575 [Armatimonadota bacterium]
MEYDYPCSPTFSEAVTKPIYEPDIGWVPYAVGWRTSQAERGWATANCYSNVRPNGHPVYYEFTIGASAGLWAKLNLRATGPNPGPQPSTWKQQGFVDSESNHGIWQVDSPGPGDSPGPAWSISWTSQAKAGGTTDTMYHHKQWADGNWFGEWGWLHAQGAWSYQTVSWHGVGSVTALVEVDCGLGNGMITAEVDHRVSSWGDRHDP